MENKISIIVPIYNAEKTINRCVDSLIGQTYKNIEIILVNDGSKDNSLLKCRQYESVDSRIKVIDKVNGGVSSARNAGLDIAKGDFIMFCDSDDWVEPDWCEQLLTNYKDGCLVMCGYYYRTNSDETKKIVCEAKEYHKTDFFKFSHNGVFAPWSKIYSTDIIKKYHIRFQQGISLGEDKLFVWRYYTHIDNGILFVDEPLYNYFCANEESLSSNIPDNYYKQMDVVCGEIYRDINNNDEYPISLWIGLCNDTFYQFEIAIKQVFHNKKLNIIERMKICDNIMRSDIYRISVDGCNVSINKNVMQIYKSKSVLGLLLLYLLKKI